MHKTNKKTHSIGLRVFLNTSLLSVIILFAISIIFSDIYASRVTEGWRDLQYNKLLLASNRVDTSMLYLKNCLISITTNARTVEIMSRNPTVPANEKSASVIQEALGSIVDSNIITTPQVYEWIWIARDGTSMAPSQISSALSSEGILPIIHQNAGKTRKTHLYGPYSFVDADAPHESFFLFGKSVVDLNTLNYYGTLLLVVPSQCIFEALSSEEKHDNTKYYVSNNWGVLLYPYDLALSKREAEEIFPFFENKADFTQKQASRILNLNNEDILISATPLLLNQYDWQLVSAAPMSSIREELSQGRRMTFFITIVVSLIALFFSLFISRSVSKPIFLFINSLKQPSNYRLATLPNRPSSSITEIHILYDKYNQLVNTINQLFEQIIKEQEERSNLQFRILQAQIKPHFLYNSLNMIKSLLNLELYDLANQALFALSRFYQLSLSSGKDIIPLSDELLLSEQYMVIQSLRYNGLLKYHTSVPDELLEYPVPRMLLQPLLENAVEHGLKGRSSAGNIWVDVREEENELILSISDDGVGMSSERLFQIQQALYADGDILSTDTAFAIRNISQRIHMWCGIEAFLTISSEPDKGTTVAIHLPKAQKKGI